MSIPKLSEHHLDQEIDHISGIAEKLNAGWTSSGIQLTEDVRTHEKTEVITLFPDEQARVMKVLKAICEDRLKELEKQIEAREKAKAAQSNG